MRGGVCVCGEEFAIGGGVWVMRGMSVGLREEFGIERGVWD